MQTFTVAKRYHTATADTPAGWTVISSMQFTDLDAAGRWGEVMNTLSHLPYRVWKIAGDNGQMLSFSSEGPLATAAAA